MLEKWRPSIIGGHLHFAKGQTSYLVAIHYQLKARQLCSWLVLLLLSGCCAKILELSRKLYSICISRMRAAKAASIPQWQSRSNQLGLKTKKLWSQALGQIALKPSTE